ncbi:MAG: hypothetical protein HY866_13515 [Chloroflexi bacterium]|nr:hypothetical protein [Chloroflexota bacterium]
MAGNGKHPLNQSHYDEITLQEYVLGQLLPDQEEEIRRHIGVCAQCRTQVAEIQIFCRRLSADLDREIEKSSPDSPLNFDLIAAEWRKPPRRVTLQFRLQRLLPGLTSLSLLVCFVITLVWMARSDTNNALENIELTKDYSGPPAIVAASVDDGLIIAQLSQDEVTVIAHLTSIIDPRNLQFSPDTRWLAFRDGHTLHVIETLHSGVHVRLPVLDDADWSWSPDSHLLAYTDGAGQLAVFDVLLNTSEVLVPSQEHAWGPPVWTASSSQIAYAVVFPLPTSQESLLRQSLWRANPQTGYRVEIARNPTPNRALLVPAAWNASESTLLVWDIKAGSSSNSSPLHRINVDAHQLEAVEGQALIQGNRLAWPVNTQGIALVIRQEQLAAVNLNDGTREFIVNPIPVPQTLDWAANGAWLAYTVSNAVEGEGLYLYALQESELRPIHLPGGATEKAVFWAGAEHLFVVRQRQDNLSSELWLVSLTSDVSPQRIMTNVHSPQTDVYHGWQWHDVMAVQMVPAS